MAVGTEPESGNTSEEEPIELEVAYHRLNAFFADYTRNIRRGGTFIPTEKPLEIGTDFVFKLSVPSLEKPLALQGRVQWLVEPEAATEAQPAGMGIGFVFESEADRQRVEGVVERLMEASLGSVLARRLMAHEAEGAS